MLELKSVSWKNFMSYGDYVTTLQLNKLGQCLIVGEIVEDGERYGQLDPVKISKSNGAGKCVTADTQVLCLDGSKRIDQLEVGQYVVSLDTHSVDSHVVVGRVTDIHQTGRKYCWKLTTRCGKFIQATLDHKILTSSGFKRLEDVDVGSQVIVLDAGLARSSEVVAAESLGVHDTWDITVDVPGNSEGNFCANGIFVHNSTIPSVIQWALFGRTMHSRAPGNSIVNYFTGQPCWVKLEFKNGDSIVRSRTSGGTSELIFVKDGDESRIVADTISTNTQQQQVLNKAFDLDWDIFCGCVFFNQYGKPWMEMADVTRKKSIERILHVDRLSYYAMCAKEKVDSLTLSASRLQIQMAELNNSIHSVTEQIQSLKSAQASFEDNKSSRSRAAKEQAVKLRQQAEAIEEPDIPALEAKWTLVAKINDKIKVLVDKKSELRQSQAQLQGKFDSLNSNIQLWNRKSGKMCVSCEQEVPADHVSAKIQPSLEQLKSLENDLAVLTADIEKLDSSISSARTLLTERTPGQSLIDARSVVKERQRLLAAADDLDTQAGSILEESNPHEQGVDNLKSQLDLYRRKLENLDKDFISTELTNRHFQYINKAYSDRNKIKSFVFRDHLPFINRRLRHYLDIFGLDIHIELTDALGISSDKWGYQFESGGERKRTDVAFMLAMFDFHEQMYGRQCNILVMDEVDGRLDDDGIDCLINIIKSDLAHRVETILVISHRNLMFDTFSREVRVTRQDRFSTLEVI